MSKKEETVKVAVRCRPLSDAEKRDNRLPTVEVINSRGEVIIRNPKTDSTEQPKTFTFDAVYDQKSTQENVYVETAYPIVDSVLEGYNGTIFAYGQTGTGKTYTMEGPGHDSLLRGIIPRAFEHVFNHIQGTPNKQFLVYASFLELYNEELRDLLSPNHYNQLELREKPDIGVYVKDLSRFPIQSVAELNQKLNSGRKSRHVGETEMNRESSRSHAIFTITVEALDLDKNQQGHIRVGKLNLVDLAGSERQNKTKSVDIRLQEAININKSLSTLGNVISALVDPKSSHVPYRDSKLTRLLQDSLGGNAKTVMIANIGPADWNYDETLGTLRYANRAKSIKNKPRINEDPKDAMIREFQDEILRLKAELEQFQSGSGSKSTRILTKDEDENRIKEIEQRLAEEKLEIQKQAEEERKRILDQRNLAEEEKQSLLDELGRKEEIRKKEKEGKERLLRKLKRLEDKVLVGTQAMEQAVKQEKDFQRIRQELEEKRAQEHKLAEELAKREEENILMERKYVSRQEELDDKKRKLQKIFQKYQALKSEIQDQEDEFNREREDYQDQIRDFSKEIKLKNLIINNFIPAEEVSRIERMSRWSEEVDDWLIPKLSLAGNKIHLPKPSSALGLPKPTSEYARIALQFNQINPRYCADNIMKFDLDMPESTLEPFTGNVSQKVQDTLNKAIHQDDDELALINNENEPNVYYIYTPQGIDKADMHFPKEKLRKVRSFTRKPLQPLRLSNETNKSNERPTSTKMTYPKARGLIVKK